MKRIGKGFNSQNTLNLLAAVHSFRKKDIHKLILQISQRNACDKLSERMPSKWFLGSFPNQMNTLNSEEFG